MRSYSLAARQRVAAEPTEYPSKRREPDPVLDRKLSGAEAVRPNADIRQGKIGRRHCIDGRTGVQAKSEHRQRQDRFPGGFARCRGFGLFGLVLRFRCRGHVRRPQMSEQKTEPSLDRPRDGSSTRHSFNWSGLWADEINSTLSPQRRLGAAAAGWFFGRPTPRRARPRYRAAGYYGRANRCPPR